MQWRVGDVTVTKVLEGEMHWPFSALLPDITPEVVAAHPWAAPYVDEDGRMILSVHALVVETPTSKVLVDTCVGNDKVRPTRPFNNLQTTFLDDLAAAGHGPDSIDTVLCTHLHVDHVGWNTRLVDGEWVPTFPTARYLFGRAEYEYWVDREDVERMGEVMADSVQPIVDAGLADFVEPTHVVCDEVRLIPTPGHTPGHVSVLIESAGETAVITGDMIHSPIQIGRPDIASSADVDQTASTSTRRSFLGTYGGTETLIIGTHFAEPTAGHLHADGDTYRFG